MSHTRSCICQTFPFWMPQEKLLFNNGTLESDEETIQLCPAQEDTEWPGVLKHSFSQLSVQEGPRGLVKTHVPRAPPPELPVH